MWNIGEVLAYLVLAFFVLSLWLMAFMTWLNILRVAQACEKLAKMIVPFEPTKSSPHPRKQQPPQEPMQKRMSKEEMEEFIAERKKR